MIETYYPEMIPHLSSCKSPQNMTGALLKSHYAEMNGIDPKDLVVVSVMPCTAKKYEVLRRLLRRCCYLRRYRRRYGSRSPYSG